MMLFASHWVIPSSRLISVSFFEKKICINYDCGELVDVEGIMCPRIETIILNCSSYEEAQKIKRQFYKAASDGKQAFYFG